MSSYKAIKSRQISRHFKALDSESSCCSYVVYSELPKLLKLYKIDEVLFQSRPSIEKKFKNLSTGIRHGNAAFGSMLFDMDTTIAMLLDTVKKLDIANNTYIFLRPITVPIVLEIQETQMDR